MQLTALYDHEQLMTLFKKSIPKNANTFYLVLQLHFSMACGSQLKVLFDVSSITYESPSLPLENSISSNLKIVNDCKQMNLKIPKIKSQRHVLPL